jgi:lipopolysaccharide heptosyltransferase II
MIGKSLVQKILVIKLRAIGDVLLSTVVLPNLRRAYPEAKIDFLAEEPSREVLEDNPDVHEAIIFNSKRRSGVGLIADVRKRRYDLVIDLFGNPRSAIVTLLSGASYRVGFRLGWRKWCYGIVVEPRGGDAHNTDFNLDALRHIGVSVTDDAPFFRVGKADDQFADEFFRDARFGNRPAVALNAGGGWSSKRWPEASYAALGDRIAADAAVLLLWGPGEEECAERIRSRMSSPATLIPRTSLKQLGAVLKKCSVLVTNDSGPMHIAAALGTPVVAIFGPTNPELQGPVGAPHVVVQNAALNCLGCNFTTCPIDHPCMKELRVEDVHAAFRKLFTSVHTRSARNIYEKAANIVHEKK